MYPHCIKLALIGSIVLLIHSGCGGPTDSDQPAPPVDHASAVPPDPAYATPELLLKQAKAIVDAPEPKMLQFYQLFQWETPAQETWRRYVQFLAVPHGNLKREFTKRFPSERLPDEFPILFYDIKIPDAKVTTVDEQRAQATFRERNRPQTLYLVEKHNRWWISGYSLEYAAKLDVLHQQAAKAGQSLDVLLAAADREHQSVLNLAERLKSGDIKTPQQFWSAAEEYFGSMPEG
ncbi:MAG: hypothetical protein L0Y44_13770 [Phycisphaerales bacterium]|nr:hypothetical protein [Phycisphaerales bacterium]MCI0631713.1 hypothetical protein [Phycisphaerales bacterium]MCI0676431.1 hypothetical protein [Phycisphaerales bacterium]